MTPYTLKGKVAIVTGGARDIGRAISIRLATAGATVMVNYSSSALAAEETVKMIAEAGGRAVAKQADITRFREAESVVDATRSAFGGKIDILVNNSGGIIARKKMEEMDEEFWDQVMALNLRTAFNMCKATMPHLNDGGAIVNLSSQAARDGGGGGAIAYSTAKGGILTFTRGLAKELGPRRIRVNSVLPGMINTAFHDNFTKPEIRQRVAGMTALGREGNAAEIAEIVGFLASDASSYINGAAIDINGGAYFA